MIDPLARGVDPVQLAFQSLVNMGVRTQPARTESPLAVALQQLGVDLAHAEPFTTAEATQFVSLVRATLEVLQTGVPADQSAHRSGALLETAQVAMHDLQRGITQVLTEHRHLTTSLAPMLRQLLVAMQAPAALSPGPRMAVPARFFFGYPRAPAEADRAVVSNRAVVAQAPPTLARLVSSLVESIVLLQAVLPLDAVPRVERLALPEHRGAPATPAAAAALPAATTRLLQTLVEVIADLLTLRPPPPAAIPGPAGPASAPHPPSAPHPMDTLVRALGETVALLKEVLPVTVGHVSEPSVPIEHSWPAQDADRLTPATAQSTPPPTATRLANSVAQVIGLVHEVLTSAPRPATEAPSAPPSEQPPTPPPTTTANSADLSPRLAPSLADVPPVLAASATDLPPLLAASLADIVTHLKAGLLPVVLETVLDASAPLLPGTLLAQLQAAVSSSAVAAGGIGAPVNSLEMFDAYRWGLLVALNYRSAVGRPPRARISVTRPRCEMCDRLLEQTRAGALVCPTC